ncbi:MAG: DUF4878 domain-containing protein [Aquificaceae bacterium]
MKKIFIALGAVLLAFFLFRACGDSPEEIARDTVKDFIEKIRDEEGKEAVKLLYPPFRDALAKDLRLPIQLTETTPSQLLACILSSMGEDIKKIKVIDSSKIDDKHTEVMVRIVDKQGVEKIFTFIVIKDEKKWRIASISGIK